MMPTGAKFLSLAGRTGAFSASSMNPRTEVAAWLIRLAEHLDMDLFPESDTPQRGEMRQELMEKLTEDWGASFAA